VRRIAALIGHLSRVVDVTIIGQVVVARIVRSADIPP
jgi:hypothetical protein